MHVSVLYPYQPDASPPANPPDYFADLNLDQLSASVFAGREEYDLSGYFAVRLRDPDAVSYRQDSLRDLERPEIYDAALRFAEQLRIVRGELRNATELRYRLQRRMWWLTGAESYLTAIDQLTEDLAEAGPDSAGFRRLTGYLADYLASTALATLRADAEQARRLLVEVSYRVQVFGDRVQVSRAVPSEPDYAADVAACFERFRRGRTASYRVKLTSYPQMNHVEEAIADRVELLYPTEFATLAEFCDKHDNFIDPVIARFDREVQFLLAWRAFTDRLQELGLPICYPTVVAGTDPAYIERGYDVALADRATQEHRRLVPNDLQLSGNERVVVITGPNQGGKTTYARMIGQFHHLTALGLTVPAESVALPVPDLIGTHFERGENLHDLTGKLDDDLVRIHRLLESTTADSLLILNEIFTSTTSADAVWLSVRVLDRIRQLGCRAVCVTFLDELARRGRDTISMVAEVEHDDPDHRTLRLVRRPADGRAYADALAARYGLTAADLGRRLVR